MRISDWSSDVCSSDLGGDGGRPAHAASASEVKINLLHRSIAAPDFRALQEAKIQCTVLVRCGEWLGPDCRIILPGMMQGRSEERGVGNGCVGTSISRW